MPNAQPAQPLKKSRTGLIVAIALLLCVALGVGGFFAWKAWSEKRDAPTAPVEEPGEEAPGEAVPEGFATAEEAVVAELDGAGYGDWVHQLYEEGADQVTFWAGPPQSEFVEEIVVAINSDGSWSVIDVRPLDISDVPGEVSARDEAMTVVSQFLYAVQDDRGEDAHALTVEPFSNDAASAQVSAGGLETFEVSGAIGKSDGSFWVETVQVWHGAEERWQYHVVPTEAGYAIAEVKAW